MFRKLYRPLPTLASLRAAIDLASIMVGVIVIAIIGAIIAASVFTVIPWSQDEKAKVDLTAVKDIQAIAKLPAPGGVGRYLETADLTSGALAGFEGKKVDDPGTLLVTTDQDGTCYVATSRSQSGQVVWYVTDKNPAPQKTAIAPDYCGIDVVQQGEDTPGPGSGPSGGGPITPVGNPGDPAVDVDGYVPTGQPNPTVFADRNGGGLGTNPSGAGPSRSYNVTAVIGGPGPSNPALPVITEAPSDTTISDVHAWIGTKEVSVTQSGWFLMSGNASAVVIGNNNFKVGSGWNSTVRSWWEDGYLSFKVGGGQPNIMRMNGATSPMLDSLSNDYGEDFVWPAVAEATAARSGVSDWSYGAGFESLFSTVRPFTPADIKSLPFLKNIHATGGATINLTNGVIHLADGRNLSLAKDLAYFDSSEPWLTMRTFSDGDGQFTSVTTVVNEAKALKGITRAELLGATITFESNGTNTIKLVDKHWYDTKFNRN
ncbi:hypothetical protein [Leifsonia sp. Leaf264]|uniref:hypothetical protein n=1 Tax=Leifsonia sp. Leaf264 TaxID=1736314 RepID=UPI0006FE783A|nr:hypothetical protein [Leifsonia sp. Leaf264]KQO98916.1 hypothetical protein ASF30_12710 [Leifsonia sp. Leaf264]